MAKKVKAVVKLQIPAGKASPTVSIGSALGPHQINIAGFCKEFNAQTQSQTGYIVPAIVTVYTDQTFTFVTKTPPAGDLLKKAAKVDKGSGIPNREKVANITKAQIQEIAQMKMVDLNAADIEGAMKIIEGSARSMGITVSE